MVFAVIVFLLNVFAAVGFRPDLWKQLRAGTGMLPSYRTDLIPESATRSTNPLGLSINDPFRLGGAVWDF